MSRPAKYIPGDLVFAKVKGYPPWPARVTSVKSSRYKVFFYGTFETATLKKEDIWPYNQEYEDKFAPKNLKRKGYTDGLDQIKNTPEIAPVEGEGLELDMSTAMDSTFDTSVDINTDTSLVIDETPKLKSIATPLSIKSKATASPKSTPKTVTSKVPPLVIPKTKSLPVTSTPSVGTPASGRSTKRKAVDSPGIAPPVKRPSVEDSPVDHEKTSRSGRVIKPKKFDDDVIASPRAVSESGGEGDGPVQAFPAVAKINKLSESKASSDGEKKAVKKVEGTGDGADTFVKAKSPKIAVVAPQKLEASEKKEPRKMWVKVKSTSDLIEINLDKEKPGSFESKQAEVQWEMATARNAIKFKNKVESGEFIPPEIRKRLEEKGALTPEDQETLRKNKVMEKRKDKLRWLKIEQRIVDLDIVIKTALHMERPEPQNCINALDELNEMAIVPLMLKKQPDIVTTIRRLRKYVGPQEYLNWPDKVARDVMIKQIETITKKADQIYNKFKSIFAYREGNRSFWEEFDKMVQEFKKKTEGMEESQILALIRDPTKGISVTNPLSDLDEEGLAAVDRGIDPECAEGIET